MNNEPDDELLKNEGDTLIMFLPSSFDLEKSLEQHEKKLPEK